jgi:hypothetical protein
LFRLQLTLSGSDVFQVKAGDRYGFTWLDLGVIDFDVVGTDNYCENPQQFNVGQQASLVANRYGRRDYSIRMLASECTEAPAPAPAGGCGKSHLHLRHSTEILNLAHVTSGSLMKHWVNIILRIFTPKQVLC